MRMIMVPSIVRRSWRSFVRMSRVNGGMGDLIRFLSDLINLDDLIRRYSYAT